MPSQTGIRDEIVRTRQNEGKKAAVEESGGNGMEKVWREENNQPVVPERKYEDHPDKKRKDETSIWNRTDLSAGSWYGSFENCDITGEWRN